MVEYYINGCKYSKEHFFRHGFTKEEMELLNAGRIVHKDYCLFWIEIRFN